MTEGDVRESLETPDTTICLKDTSLVCTEKKRKRGRPSNKNLVPSAGLIKKSDGFWKNWGLERTDCQMGFSR